MTVSAAKGRVLWAQAELLEAEAHAYRNAAAAAKEIGEAETVTRWTNTANEKQAAAVQGFASAKALGCYSGSETA